jgi:two-component system, response regulator PdtaR
MEQNKSILIVEDELIIAEDISSKLTRLGYKVLGVAVSADEAIAKIRQNPPDLLLLDIHLQGAIDGIELARLVSDDWDIPFIYLTAHADEPTYTRAIPTRPSAYLLKPFHESELIIALELALQQPVSTADKTSLSRVTELDKGISADVIYIRKRGRFERILLKDILFLEASGNSTEVITEDRRFIVNESLSHFFEQISSNRFIRIHRSYVVNLDYVNAIEEARLFIGTRELPISKSYKPELHARFRFF